MSGSAVVTVTGQGKVANPSVQIFGEADDGSPFIANGQGVGAVGAQVARIVSPTLLGLENAAANSSGGSDGTSR